MERSFRTSRIFQQQEIFMQQHSTLSLEASGFQCLPLFACGLPRDENKSIFLQPSLQMKFESKPCNVEN